MRKIVSLLLGIAAFLGGISGLQIKAASITQNYPEGFTWGGHEINIHFDTVSQSYVSDFDITQYKNNSGTGVTYYVDVVNGINTNPGTSELPFKTVAKAYSMEDVETIVLKDGSYDRTNGFGFDIQKDINIIGSAGVYILPGEFYSTGWTLTAGYTNVYEYTRSATSGAVLLNKTTNEHQMLKTVASIELVDSTPGSFFTDNTKVYVRLSDDSVPDENLFISMLNSAIRIDASNVYLEDLNIIGGVNTINAFNGSTLYANNIRVGFSILEDLLSVNNSNSYVVNSQFNNGYLDGLSYQQTDENQYYFYEENILSYNNGLTATSDSNNASTSHQQAIGIRINGNYHTSKGPIIADVDKARTLNYGLEVHDSQAIDLGLNINYLFYGIDPLNMIWIYRPNSYGSEFNYSVGIINPDTLTRFTVSFVTFEGSAIEPIVYDEGDKVIVASPTREGYTFVGWFIDQDLTQQFSLINDRINEDTTLYAKWITNNTGVIDTPNDEVTISYKMIAIAGVVALFGLYILKKKK